MSLSGLVEVLLALLNLRLDRIFAWSPVCWTNLRTEEERKAISYLSHLKLRTATLDKLGVTERCEPIGSTGTNLSVLIGELERLDQSQGLVDGSSDLRVGERSVS